MYIYKMKLKTGSTDAPDDAYYNYYRDGVNFPRQLI